MKVRAFAAVYDPRSRNRTQRFQQLVDFARRWIIRVETARTIIAIPVAGEGVWIRPNTAAGLG
jgi:hypothetical protein